MLQLNLSDAEIQRLNYERFYYPCPHIQKRIHAVYFKTMGMNNKTIGTLTGLNHETVGDWIRAYRSEERRVGKECRSRWSPYH